MADKETLSEEMVEQYWHSWALDGPPREKVIRQGVFKVLPGQIRCKFCYAPFDGASGFVVKNVFRVHPSRYNELYCDT